MSRPTYIVAIPKVEGSRDMWSAPILVYFAFTPGRLGGALVDYLDDHVRKGKIEDLNSLVEAILYLGGILSNFECLWSTEAHEKAMKRLHQHLPEVGLGGIGTFERLMDLSKVTEPVLFRYYEVEVMVDEGDDD